MSETTDIVNEEENAGEVSAPSVEEMAEAAKTVFQDIVDGLGVDAIVGVASIDGTDIHIDAEGDEEEGGLLIGRRGQTLEAVQLLVGAIISRRTPQKLRIFLDAFGYRERRADSLRRMALEVAAQVRSTGQEAVTEPLNAAERRIIHTALQDETGISTYSEGQDPQRYVVISPAE